MSIRLHEWLFLALVISLPIMEPWHWTIGGSYVPISDPVFVVAVAVWAAAVLRGTAAIRRGALYWPLALYLAALALSSAVSADPRRSMLKLAGEAYLIACAALTFNVVRTPRMLRLTWIAWMAGAAVTVVAGLHGVVMFYTAAADHLTHFGLSDYGSLPPGPYPRVDGLFNNMNMACTYLTASLVFLLGMHRLQWISSGWVWALGTGIWVTALFTFSPGIGGMFLAVGLWCWSDIERWSRRVRASVAALCVVIAALFVVAITISPTILLDRASASMLIRRIEPSSRVLAWMTALETFARDPVLGHGVGLEVSDAYYVSAAGLQEHFTDAHNVWLSIAGQAGVVGLAAFTILVLFLLSGLLPLDVSTRSAVMRSTVAMTFITAFLYQGLSGAFEDTRHVWFVIGMLGSVKAGFDDQPATSPPFSPEFRLAGAPRGF